MDTLDTFIYLFICFVVFFFGCYLFIYFHFSRLLVSVFEQKGSEGATIYMTMMSTF